VGNAVSALDTEPTCESRDLRRQTNSNLPYDRRWLFFLNHSSPSPCVFAEKGVIIGRQAPDADGTHKQEVYVVLGTDKTRESRGKCSVAEVTVVTGSDDDGSTDTKRNSR
jgi:hypothetical protein